MDSLPQARSTAAHEGPTFTLNENLWEAGVKIIAAHLKLKCRITQKNSVKFLPAPAAFFGGVFLHTVERCSLTLERMVFLHA